MRLFLCLSLFTCLACYPDRVPTEDESLNPPETAVDAGEAQEDPVDESPDAGEQEPEEPMDAGQEAQEPEPTVDAGSEPVNEETMDAGPQCDPGYFENGATGECEDVNECLQSNGGCLQTCLNTAGGFECGCFAGYDLNDDDVSCHDINECEENIDGCEENCINTQGAYECSCNSSRFLNEDGLTCQSNMESAQTVATNWGVGDISLELNADDLYDQSSLAGSVNFVDAFSKALQSFLTDDADDYSPLKWVAGFDGTGDTLPLYMNQHYTYIYLVPNRARLTTDAWFPPELGESIEENWVFFMTGDAELNALFWAIVPRNGEPVYNYGYD